MQELVARPGREWRLAGLLLFSANAIYRLDRTSFGAMGFSRTDSTCQEEAT